MDARMGNFSTKIAKNVIILRIFLHHVELRISDQFCDFFSNENINLDLASIPKKNLCDECDKVLLECLDLCDNVPTCISDCNRDHITCIDTC